MRVRGQGGLTWHRSRFGFEGSRPGWFNLASIPVCVLFPSRGFGFSDKRGQWGSTYHVGYLLTRTMPGSRRERRSRAGGSTLACDRFPLPGDGANGVDPGIAARRTKARKGGRIVRGAGVGGWPGEPGAVRSTGRSDVIPVRSSDGGVRPSEPGGEARAPARSRGGAAAERVARRTRAGRVSPVEEHRHAWSPPHLPPIKGARPVRSGSEARVGERDHPPCKVLRPPHCRGERPTRLAGSADR